MIIATLGFLFTPDLQHVLLIEKRRPAFHKGKLNGLGGKCEDGEELNVCMSRELQEESGLTTSPSDWLQIGTIHWTEWHVVVFAGVFKGNREDAQSVSEGTVRWYPTAKLPENVISNLRWLIPLAVDCLHSKESPLVEVRYSQK